MQNSTFKNKYANPFFNNPDHCLKINEFSQAQLQKSIHYIIFKGISRAINSQYGTLIKIYINKNNGIVFVKATE